MSLEVINRFKLSHYPKIDNRYNTMLNCFLRMPILRALSKIDGRGVARCSDASRLFIASPVALLQLAFVLLPVKRLEVDD